MTTESTTGVRAATATGRHRADSPPPIRFYLTLTIASTALWMAMVTPVLVLLPEQAKGVAADAEVGVYALVAGVGGLLGSIANPFAGRLSDRTRSSFGRRRPWIAGGALGGAVSLVFLGQVTGLAGLLFGWVAFQISGSLVLAALSATIPDRMPENRLGTAAACLGVSWVLSPILGTALAAAVDNRIEVAYGALGLVLLVACAVFVVMAPDTPHEGGPPSALRPREMPWATLRRNPDLGYAWLTRFCVALGQNIALAFLYFFLQDAVRYTEGHPGQSTADGLMVLTLIYAVTAVVASIAGGTVSDRLALRKPFVVVATVVFALGAGLGALYPTWTGVLALAVLTGLGFGVYEATDMALITQLLPSDTDRARDLSLINMATTLGITLGPIVGAPVFALGGYTTLYLISGLVVLLGAVFVFPIRGAR